MTPLVSVILPTFDRVDYLRATIDSILAQSFSEWELRIADDGSSEPTRRYLRGIQDARVTTLWLPHSGIPSIARNAAIHGARGRYVAFADSDDLWLPEKLEVQLAALRARPSCRWSFTATQRVDAHDRPIEDETPFVPHEGRIFDELLRVEAYVATPTVLAERSLVVEAGAFDEQLTFGEDYDLWLRLASRSDVVVVNERLTRVRLHGRNFSHDRIGFYEGWLRLYAKAEANTTEAAAKDLCRRRRAELSLGLANLQADRRDTAAVARTVARAWRLAGGAPLWRWGAAKALVRSAVPSRLLSAFRNRRRVR